MITQACLEVWNVIQASQMNISFFVGTVLALMREICKVKACSACHFQRDLLLKGMTGSACWVDAAEHSSSV